MQRTRRTHTLRTAHSYSRLHTSTPIMRYHTRTHLHTHQHASHTRNCTQTHIHTRILGGRERVSKRNTETDTKPNTDIHTKLTSTFKSISIEAASHRPPSNSHAHYLDWRLGSKLLLGLSLPPCTCLSALLLRVSHCCSLCLPFCLFFFLLLLCMLAFSDAFPVCALISTHPRITMTRHAVLSERVGLMTLEYTNKRPLG